MTAACSSPLCDYTCIQVEAEDVVGQRTVKELCEKVEHCIYTLYLSAQKVLTATLAFILKPRIIIYVTATSMVQRDLSSPVTLQVARCCKPGLGWKPSQFLW